MQLKQPLLFFTIVSLLSLTSCHFVRSEFVKITYDLSKCPRKEFTLPLKVETDDLNIKYSTYKQKDLPALTNYQVLRKDFWIFTSPKGGFRVSPDSSNCSIIAFAGVYFGELNRREQIDYESQSIEKAKNYREDLDKYISLLLAKTKFRLKGEPTFKYLGNLEESANEFSKYGIHPTK